ncbi:MAG TPA: sulfatase-like hydrolase/transferase [Patescibacteria group bacterium]|nr:sulfatase-like hydrolase/transferase [Patescibacteria group bacterium]
MKKKLGMLLLAAAILVLLAVAYQFILKKPSHPSARGMNLLLITLDTTRADRLGAYGYSPALTPNLDALAKDGVRLENAYTPVPITLPAHCSLFSGLYPGAHGVRNNGTYRLHPGVVTLAEILQTAGYQTYAVVSSYVLMAKFGLDQGFERYDDSLDAGTLVNDFQSEIPAEQVYGKFREWMEQCSAKKFFAWLHFYDPHQPYLPHKTYLKKVSHDESGLYDNEIAHMDEYIGAVLHELKTRGLLENTLVVAVGDHGEGFGEHQEFGHGIFCYEEALRVPLILYNPALFPAGTVLRQRVNLADLMPTLLDLLEVQAPPRLQGASFASQMDGKSDPATRAPLYFESLFGQEDMNWAPLTGILSDHFKYISLPQPELYDLSADPGERTNILTRNPSRARELDRELTKMIVAYNREAGPGRRDLSAADRRNLQALGYLSQFKQGRKDMDPKLGVVINNRLRAVLKQLDKKEFAAAAQALKDTRAGFPELDMPFVYYIDYQIARAQEHITEARAILLSAIARFPDNEMFRMQIAQLSYDSGSFQEAESRALELVALRPDFTQAHLLVAKIKEEQGRFPEAAAACEKALASEPENVSLKLKCAELQIVSKNFLRARELYDSLLSSAKGRLTPEIMFKIALFQFQYGEPLQAEALLREILTLQPAGKYYFNFALILFKGDKTAEALANMKIARERFAAQLTAEQKSIAEKAIAAWQEIH